MSILRRRSSYNCFYTTKSLHQKQILLLIAALLLCAFAGNVQVQAQEFSFSGYGTTEYGVYLPPMTYGGDCAAAATTVHGELDFWQDEFSAFSAIDINHRIQNKQESENRAFLLWGKSSVTVTLKELWAEYAGSRFAIRAGRQISAWGKADGIQITDILCPQDLTTLSAADYSASRLGIDAVRLSYNGDTTIADVYWIPYFTPSKLPLEEENPLRQALLPSSISTGGFSIPVTLGTLEEPELKFKNNSFAARLCTYLPFGDFAAYAYYGFDSQPFLKYELKMNGYMPSEICISGEYKRLTMFGFDAAIPLGEVVLRAEGAFFPNRYFACTPETVLGGGSTTVQKNQLSALAGIDWNPDGWTITAQYFENIVFNHEDCVNRKWRTCGSTFNVSRSFMRETLDVSLTYAINWIDWDSMMGLSASYALSDEMTLTVSADGFFEGIRATGEYGAYKNLSNIKVKAEYRF